MSLINAREELVDAMNMGISPTIPALEEFVEEVNDFLLLINDYDEWDAVKESTVWDSDQVPHQHSEPAITVKKLRKMAGFAA